MGEEKHMSLRAREVVPTATARHWAFVAASHAASGADWGCRTYEVGLGRSATFRAATLFGERRTRRAIARRFPFIDASAVGARAFVVIDRKTGKIIGSSRYCDLKPEESQVEVGYTFLERTFWGGAYNREMKQLMLDHAFKFVKRVVFLVGDTNFRSQKAIEGIGAKRDGVLRHHQARRDGTVRDSVMFSILKEEWRDVRRHLELRLSRHKAES